jgi:small subunit ribosomal protein S15
MHLTSDKKKEIFAQYGESAVDTGSPEGQVAMFTQRITHLTEHLKENKKDRATRRSLVALVGKRRSLLEYLKENDIERYRAIVKNLGIRK